MVLSGKKIVLGVTGSIAAYKAVMLLRDLMNQGAEVTVVMTEAACRFITPLTFETLSQRQVYADTFRLTNEFRIPHIKLAQEADLILIAPATANFIGKMAGGIADDLLSSILLATRAPVIVAPAMDEAMLEHPIVQQNMSTLKELGFIFVEPSTGALASGAVGRGRLAEEGEIVSKVSEVLAERGDFKGRTILITAGPTREYIDPVRFISNRSSGKMGYALTAAAKKRGAEVILVSGPSALSTPIGIRFIPVESAEEMRKAVIEYSQEADVIIMAAAVADYRPKHRASNKIDKGRGMILELEETADIIQELGQKKGKKIIVGFAAETGDLVERARTKLVKKNLDLIVANDVTLEGAGFDRDTNIVKIIDRKGVIDLPKMGKYEVAERVLDRVKDLW